MTFLGVNAQNFLNIKIKKLTMKFKSDAQRKAVMANMNSDTNRSSPTKSVQSIMQEKSRELRRKARFEQDEEYRKSSQLRDDILNKKKSVFKKPYNHVSIIGKRWNDSYGNTYHTSEVYVDGSLVEKSDVVYGYGDQFEETAKDILVEKGYLIKAPTSHLKSGIKTDTSLFNAEVRANRKKFTIAVTDVGRKKDL